MTADKLQRKIVSILSVTIMVVVYSVTCFADNDTKTPLHQRQDIQDFIQNMVKSDHFDQQQLETLFDEVKLQQSVIQAINHPAEAKPWHFYQKLFLSAARINGGVRFWQDHLATFTKVENTYGVPTAIIIAILGIETSYGKNQGNYRVIDALSTLAFDYPPRAKYFKYELKQYLRLTRENNIDPTILKGSYAGAIGQPQFMPSSYRHYAVDYSNNHHIDLQNNTDDVIASVANYLSKNGWKKNGLITVPAKINGENYKSVLQKRRVKPTHTITQLQTYGIQPLSPIETDQKAALFSLDKTQQAEFWLGFNNFYTITRYNTSTNYAMAVHYLAKAIEDKFANKKITPIANKKST